MRCTSPMELRISWVLLMSLLFNLGYCWDNDELEIFDLVEELGINTNFYTLLDVPENAEPAEIRKAYRRLSLVLHPDKNDAADAEVKFRQLVAVYDVLRDSKKRLLYNEVLLNGLPDWKHAIYYYRRVRKMGLAEMSIILFLIITVGQYIVAWAAYAEKKFTFEQLMDMKLKKLQKKQKKGKYDGPPLPESIAVDIPKPSVWNTLPIQIPRFIWFIITGAPKSVRFLRAYWAERKRRKEEEEMWSEEEEEVVEEVRQPRRRKAKFSPPELTESSNDLAAFEAQNSKRAQDHATDEPPPPVVSGGLWTDDDLVELIRLIKKYPPGTSARWERIANSMNRTVSEVTHMARKVKEDGYRVGKPAEEVEADPAEVKKVKTRGGKLGAEGEEGEPNFWSQPQQRALEAALSKFPKGGSGERWEKIAKCVPGKTKEECVIRYKQLVELLKKKKENGEVCQEVA